MIMYWWVVYDVPEGGRMMVLVPTEKLLEIMPNEWYLALVEILTYIIQASLAVAFMAIVIKRAIEVIKGELSR